MPNIGDIIRAEDLEAILEQINNSSSNIVGELKYFGFTEVPEHCLMCDGSEISRETYSELFAKYGTIYGEGDGSTTFNLPDYRGAFLRCIGGNAAELGIEQGDAIRDIDGSFSIRDVGVSGMTITGDYGQGTISVTPISDPGGNHIVAIGSALGLHNITFAPSRIIPTAPEVRPINYAVNVCVVFE